MRFNSTTNFLILAVLTVAIVYGLLIYMSSLLHKQGSLFQEHVQLFVDQDAREQAYATVVKRLDETEDEREALTGHILNGEDDAIMLLSETDALASDLGLSVTTDSLEVRSRDNDRFNALDVTFSVEGNEDSVEQFIALLEMLPYHVYARDIALSRVRTEGALTGNANATITMSFTIEDVEL